MTNGLTNIALSNVKSGLSCIGYRGWHKLLALILLAAMADWLFYYGYPVGISAVIFLLALNAAVIFANPVHANRHEIQIAICLFAAGVAPWIIEPGTIEFLLMIASTACCAVMLTRSGANTADTVFASLALLFGGWRALPEGWNGAANWMRSDDGGARHARGLMTWIMPAVLGLIFIQLFASANPLIDGWIGAIELSAIFAHIEAPRVAFWISMMMIAWPFVFMRLRSRTNVKPDLSMVSAEQPASRLPQQIFSKAAILRSLILFNLLFAMQTLLDVAYLWGGMALPDGLSYAAYAHRGAYPLVVTALLAAVFVVAAMRPGSETERAPFIRHLVFLWIGQNILLVVSSILRLDLYVEVYSLTYLRVAAFIWMILVAFGLILIVARIALGKPNSWLVAMNAGALAVTLYLCFFVNFPHVIASYNVAHSREIAGQGAALDVGYLLSLGPQAIPALDRYFELKPNLVPAQSIATRNRHAEAYIERMKSWRGWSFRDGQLVRYLRDKPRVLAMISPTQRMPSKAKAVALFATRDATILPIALLTASED